MACESTPKPAPRPLKGRGTASRLQHRFDVRERAWVDDGWTPAEAASARGGSPTSTDFADGHAAPGIPTATTVRAEPARTLLSRNNSPDIPFTTAINPYRGCEHGCIYCYARPTHSYLNLSPGLDFETQLIAKSNAAEALRQELKRPGYVASPIQIGSATDAYQPVEREWRLTRVVLEVLDACRHPYTIVTKSSGVERDLDLLVSAAARQQVYVMVSITSLDAALSRKLEPRAAAPWRRLETVRRLSGAGVPVGVNLAPIIPFLNEPEIEQVIEAAGAAGAHRIHYTVVRLPWEVRPLFEQWLQDHVPDRAARIMARIQDLGGGEVYNPDFRTRMKGQGLWADLIRQRVSRAVSRAGMDRPAPRLDTTAFDPRRLAGGPSAATGTARHAAQADLFDGPTS